MTKQNNKPIEHNPLWLIVLGLVGLGSLLAVLLRNSDIALLKPQGLRSGQEYNLMLLTTAILLLIAVPTLWLFYYVAWKYRETNAQAAYDPTRRHGRWFVFGMWAVPSVIMVVLSVIMWSATHRLEPQDAIASSKKPLTVQVVALRWKWLFIYPEQQIATVNFVQIPTDRPVQFELTADEVPMSSFWIPHLSGQLYAMTGHVNRLNILAEKPGDYPGSSAEINGPGFAGMKFVARAVPESDFAVWTESVQESFVGLDTTQYQKLLTPSENHPYQYFSTPQPNLYATVVMKYMGTHAHGEGHAATKTPKHTEQP